MEKENQRLTEIKEQIEEYQRESKLLTEDMKKVTNPVSKRALETARDYRDTAIGELEVELEALKAKY
jgi:hypothetical protein